MPRNARTRSSSPALLERVGHHVRARREAAGLTIREIASRSGLSPRFVSMVEAGLGNISLSRLEELAAALDASPAEILVDAAKPLPVRPVALLGLRGAGKSTLGAKAAAATGRRFVELDRLVEEAAGMPLGEIFAVHGYPYYRKLEREALAALLRASDPVLVATGGGIVVADDTFDTLRRACVDRVAARRAARSLGARDGPGRPAPDGEPPRGEGRAPGDPRGAPSPLQEGRLRRRHVAARDRGRDPRADPDRRARLAGVRSAAGQASGASTVKSQ